MGNSGNDGVPGALFRLKHQLDRRATSSSIAAESLVEDLC
jgi:hypothetical protein